ncbi:unnamed protein product, partial [Symbiodinium necroappetens]
GKSGPIANGWRAVLVFHKGDEKYLQKVYGMVNSATSKNVCFVCQATTDGGSPNLYTHHGPSAPHRQTMFSTADFIRFGCRDNPFIRYPGFHVTMICGDWLHVMDLAVVPDACGSALLELSENSVVWPGSTQDERLQHAYTCFVAECKASNVRAQPIYVPSMHAVPAHGDAFPSIAQKHLNGAEAFILAKWLMGVTLRVAHANPGDRHAALRAAVFCNLVHMREAISIEKHGNRFVTLSEPNLRKLQQANFLFHAALNSLASEAIAARQLLWKLRPKLHKLQSCNRKSQPLKRMALIKYV